MIEERWNKLLDGDNPSVDALERMYTQEQLETLAHIEDDLRTGAFMTIDEQIRRNIEREPIFIPYIGDDAPVHTQDHPFCDDLDCPCHFDSGLMKEQIERPYLDGLLTEAEGERLYHGEQL